MCSKKIKNNRIEDFKQRFDSAVLGYVEQGMSRSDAEQYVAHQLAIAWEVELNKHGEEQWENYDPYQ